MLDIKRIISMIMVLAMALTAFTACSKGGDEGEKAPEAGNVPGKEYNYLTGLPVDENMDMSARPVAVMINNLKVALPQNGLENADLIYEAVTEGGITRLMAVYSDIDKIEKVGPVRSARDQFVEMMLPLNAIYVHIGASTSSERMLNFYSYQDIDGIYLGFLAFRQDAELAKTKGPEHSWFTNSELIKAGINKTGVETKNDFYPAFDFVDYEKEDRVLPLEGANTITFSYSGYADVGFAYDEETGRYKKSAFGIPHMDADTNTQVAFDNVFVLLTDVGIQEENGILPDFSMEGGSGYYFCNGHYEEITWKKGAPENPLILLDANGEVLKVNPGKSYIGLLDNEMADTIVISEEVQSVANVERVQ